MNGALAMLRTAAAAGVDLCAANPGTTELPLVAALDAVPEIRPVLALSEPVVAGIADGYGRVARRPALALLHLGPGLANAAANLHNARRAHTPLVALVGEHTAAHLPLDSPITMDLPRLAAAIVDEVIIVDEPPQAAAGMATAVEVASLGRVVALVAGADVQTGAAQTVAPKPETTSSRADLSHVPEVAELLRTTPKALLLLDGEGLTARAQRAAARIAAGTGCGVWVGTFPAVMDRGGDLPALLPIPYAPPMARAVLDVPLLVFAGSRTPVAMFGPSDGTAGRLVPEETRVVDLAPRGSVAAALEALAELVGADPAPSASPPPVRPDGALDPERLAAATAWALPEGAIVVDEGITATRSFLAVSGGARRHRYLRLTGGALGFGLPAAAGAALATGRPVVALQADGAAQYALPALWTQAREGLNVTTVMCVNDAYRILQVEMRIAGIDPGPAASSLVEFRSPIDWCRLAEGYGVAARELGDAGSLADALAAAVSDPDPQLLVVRL